MIFVYRTQQSVGAKNLVAGLGDDRAIRWRDRLRPIETKVKTGDRVICWGEYNPRIPADIATLNNKPLTNKLTDAETLIAKGVPTIEVSRTKPQDTTQVIPAGPDPAIAQWERFIEVTEDFANIELDTVVPRNQVTLATIDEILRQVQTLRNAVAQPAPTEQRIVTEAKGWLGRDRNHVGGADLLNPITTPDYYVKKIDDIVNEYRVHSFLGKSIRAGIKQHRTDDEWVRSGKTPHAWVRSWDGGWRIAYDGVSSKKKHRELAKLAIEALGLDFGAVDIGERADGSLVVFEVNRAPGVELGTVDAYVNAINVWINGGWEAAAPREEA